MKIKPIVLDATTVAKFNAKFASQADGCWQWNGTVLSSGYGVFVASRAIGPRLAHRVAWTIARGAIPDGLVLDHLCRNRRCVNPSHLEVVTQRTNALRGAGHTAINAAKTRCLRGHELTPDNVYLKRGGTSRCCKKCIRITRADRYARLGL